MQTFNFYADEKHTIWTRIEFTIKAETYEQALEKIKEVEKGDYSVIYDDEMDTEYLYETLEEMTPEENDNQATFEIHSEDTNELIYTNEIKTK
jgi:hypothetical protein